MRCISPPEAEAIFSPYGFSVSLEQVGCNATWHCTASSADSPKGAKMNALASHTGAMQRSIAPYVPTYSAPKRRLRSGHCFRSIGKKVQTDQVHKILRTRRASSVIVNPANVTVSDKAREFLNKKIPDMFMGRPSESEPGKKFATLAHSLSTSTYDEKGNEVVLYGPRWIMGANFMRALGHRLINRIQIRAEASLTSAR